MRFVIATDILIDHFRGVEKAGLLISKLQDKGVICFSTITEAEILSGQECESDDRRDRIIDFLFNFVKIPVDSEIAQIGGKIRRKHKTVISDSIIAATAIKLKAKLVTKNLKDFKKIEGLEIFNSY